MAATYNFGSVYISALGKRQFSHVRFDCMARSNIKNI